MADPKRWTAGQVLDKLRKGPLRAPAHAWLENVRNETGYARRQQRYADALVVSLWPSRGIWFAGIEVKISRGDWLRELKKPDKTDEIQRFCDYWWVAAPAGIVKLEELPETWGLYEVDGKTVKAIKSAPKLKPEAPAPAFIASILRNESEKLESARAAGRNEGHESAAEKYDAGKMDELQQQLADAQRELRRVQDQLKYKEADLDRLRRAVQLFEEKAGIPVHSISTGWRHENEAPKLYRMAQVLAQVSELRLVGLLEQALSGLRGLVQLQESLQETTENGPGPRVVRQEIVAPGEEESV